MLVKLSDIDPTFTVTLNGAEDWLSEIYDNFPVQGEGDRPILTGNLRLDNVADGNAVRATGKISYAPVVECFRCTEPLIWPLDLKIDMYFQPEPEGFGKTTSLRATDLEQYFYKDNDKIDVEELLNDAIHLQLPNRITCEMQTGKVCAPELDRDPDEDSSRENPFAVLADLKLDDN